MNHNVDVLEAEELSSYSHEEADLVDLDGLPLLVHRTSGRVIATTLPFTETWSKLPNIVSYVVGRGAAAKVHHYYVPPTATAKSREETTAQPRWLTKRLRSATSAA